METSCFEWHFQDWPENHFTDRTPIKILHNFELMEL